LEASLGGESGGSNGLENQWSQALLVYLDLETTEKNQSII
jgi:hypothetical protein